jgi:hypothetical protein
MPAHRHCTDTAARHAEQQQKTQKQRAAETTAKSTPLQNETSCTNRNQGHIHSSERVTVLKPSIELVAAISLA